VHGGFFFARSPAKEEGMEKEDISTESLASNLRAARMAEGWSVEELAERADIEAEDLSAIERGAKCQEHHLNALSRALGIPVRMLLPNDVANRFDAPTAKSKWPTIIVTTLFVLVAIRTLLASFGY
jgi:transcriptional regulator with XRE-family HTH domain